MNMNAAFDVWPVISSFWTDFDRCLAVFLSSVTCCGRNNEQCVLLELEYVK